MVRTELESSYSAKTSGFVKPGAWLSGSFNEAGFCEDSFKWSFDRN